VETHLRAGAGLEHGTLWIIKFMVMLLINVGLYTSAKNFLHFFIAVSCYHVTLRRLEYCDKVEYYWKFPEEEL
jgi:hypothetical protein